MRDPSYRRKPDFTREPTDSHANGICSYKGRAYEPIEVPLPADRGDSTTKIEVICSQCGDTIDITERDPNIAYA